MASSLGRTGRLLVTSRSGRARYLATRSSRGRDSSGTYCVQQGEVLAAVLASLKATPPFSRPIRDVNPSTFSVRFNRTPASSSVLILRATRSTPDAGLDVPQSREDRGACYQDPTLADRSARDGTLIAELAPWGSVRRRRSCVIHSLCPAVWWWRRRRRRRYGDSCISCVGCFGRLQRTVWREAAKELARFLDAELAEPPGTGSGRGTGTGTTTSRQAGGGRESGVPCVPRPSFAVKFHPKWSRPLTPTASIPQMRVVSSRSVESHVRVTASSLLGGGLRVWCGVDGASTLGCDK